MPKTLLLADDSATIQKVIELSFADDDVRVVSVADGRRAIDWMAGEPPDIVLVDVQAPEVDGYGVAEHMKQSRTLSRVPVVMLAGAFDPIDQDRLRDLGCDGVMVKPFEPQQLVSRVKELLDRPGADPEAGDRRSTEPEHRTVTPFPARAALPADGPVVAEPLEPPARPVWDQAGLPSTSPLNVPTDVAMGSLPRVSLVNAFSALLAAEQSNHLASPAPAQPVLSDATVEEAVRRVLTRMTDDLVRRLVVETAERLIKEEIEKIKTL